MTTLQEFRELIQRIKKYGEPRISCVIGAGLSAGSGLSTFRGENGMWEEKNPEELASRRGFENDPELVWSWYRDRIKQTFEAEPNAGHKALVDLEKMGILELIVTQNVDNLHRQAGQSEDKIIEIHGTLSRTHCLENCGRSYQLEAVPEEVPVMCECGSYQRPSVVWFGEAVSHSIYDIIDQMTLNSNLLLVIGTSGYVQPVASLPVILARNMPVININPDISAFKGISEISFAKKAEEILPEMVTIIREELKDIDA